MIIYNKLWLLNLEIQDHLKKALKNGDISPEEFKKVEEKYPVGFYTPNIFIRIGLFLLTLVVISFSFAFIALVSNRLSLFESGSFFLTTGLIIYALLETCVKQMHHYRSGVDDALMWVSSGLILYSMILFLDKAFLGIHHAELITATVILILSTYFTLRFMDMFMGTLSFISLIAVIFFGWQDFGFYSLQTMPFLMMGVAYLIYVQINLLEKKKQAAFYSNSIIVTKILSLLLGYLAGNYFVVRELQEMMTDTNPESSVPFAWFFWAWTILVPFIYIGLGILKKNVILLRSGLILVAAAAFTFRNYYHVMPVEAALSIVGAILLILAYSVMKYLKTPKYGFTTEEIDDDQLLDKIKVESLIVGETFSGTTAPESSRLGGGDLGGGGASGSF